MKKVLCLLAVFVSCFAFDVKAAEITLSDIVDKFNASEVLHEGMTEDEALEASYTGDLTSGSITVYLKANTSDLEDVVGDLEDTVLEYTSKYTVTDGIIRATFDADLFSAEDTELNDTVKKFIVDLMSMYYFIPDSIGQAHGYADGEVYKMMANTEYAEAIASFTLDEDGWGMTYDESTNEITISADASNPITLLTKSVTAENDMMFLSEQPFNKKYTLSSVSILEDLEESVKTQINSDLEGKKLIDLYEVSLMNGSTVIPMEDGSYTLRIKITDAMENYEGYNVVYIDDDYNVKETLEPKEEDGYLTVSLTHLSKYGVVGTEIVNPKTYDNTIMMIIVGAFGVALMIGGYFLLKQKTN